MAFDKRIIEAKLALGMIPPEGLPPLAWDALEAGLDGNAVRRMAALDRPTGFETDALLSRFMEQTELGEISVEIASARLTQALVRRILRDGSDPLRFTAELEGWWIRALYPEQLACLGLIDEDVQVDRYYQKSEDSTRLWVLERLRLAAEEELP